MVDYDMLDTLGYFNRPDLVAKHIVKHIVLAFLLLSYYYYYYSVSMSKAVFPSWDLFKLL